MAKKSPTETTTPTAATTVNTTAQHKPHLQQTHHTNYIKKPKEIISPSVSTTSLHQSPPPQASPAPPAPKAQPFDINVLYNQIHNEKKLKEQQVNVNSRNMHI